MDMTILIIGTSGMLGRDLAEACLQRELHTICLAGRADLDVTNQAGVHEIIARVNTRVVINASGYTDVDGAEADESGAESLNCAGPEYLAQACAETNALLVHYSTDYVFDGRADSPYLIDAPTDPQGAYGRTKLAGEKAIRASGSEHLICRTSWLHAPHGKNFVRTILTSGLSTAMATSDRFYRYSWNMLEKL